jgi:hypothetical protein
MLMYLGAICLTNALFVSLLHSVAERIQFSVGDISLHPMNLLFVLLFMDSVPLYFFVRERELARLQYQFTLKQWKPVVVVFLFFIIASSTMLIPALSLRGNSENSLLILDKGEFNWDKPRFGQYGLRAAGMFGMLPAYLETMGYELKKDSLLTGDNLEGVKVVIVINLNSVVAEQEKERIKQFVYDGGSLLVLGDHTDMMGVMGPLNTLIDFVNIRYKFDSAHYLKRDWRDSFEQFPHAIFTGITDETDVGISVGASLEFSPLHAKPVLAAKYGFSDAGDYMNTQNAYLGDRRYNQGELLGDLILVAEAPYGKGKVLVFGDTSSFQNGSLAYTYTFVQNVLRYLSRTEDNFFDVFFRTGFFLSFLLGIFSCFLVVKIQYNPAIVLWVSLLVLSTSVVIHTMADYEMEIVGQPSPIAYIDASHLNRFTAYGDDGIWALTYHLMRNNYLPVVSRTFSSELMEKSAVAIFISPAKALQASELETIDKYIRSGGVVIWSVGYEEKESSKEILTKYGFDIDNVPLGPIPRTETNAGIRFKKAWPVMFQGSEPIDTICTGWSYPVIAATSLEKGKFVLVADAHFFLAENLEANHTFSKSNDLFLSVIQHTQRPGNLVEQQ